MRAESRPLAFAATEDRTMSSGQYLSTAEVCEILGVGVTTVKRWVDEGVLPAHRTLGGHRRILSTDLLRLVRDGHYPHLDLDRLGLTVPICPAATEGERAAAFYAALRGGKAGAVRELLTRAFGQGMSVDQLGDTLVRPAMARLGHDWEAGRIDVFHEHRATRLVETALVELKATLETNAQKDRPLAVGGNPENDPTVLGSLLVQMVLIDAGWEAVNLGPNTPLASFGQALAELRPRLFWLSVGHVVDAPRFLEEYHELYRQAADLGVAVAVGGRGLNEALRAALPYTTFGDGLAHLAAFARSLHPRPRRPRRGRPPGSEAKR